MSFFEVALLGIGIAMIVIGIMVLYRLKRLSDKVDYVSTNLGPLHSLNTWLHHLHKLDSIEKHARLIYDLLRPEAVPTGVEETKGDEVEPLSSGMPKRWLRCRNCKHEWAIPEEVIADPPCPKCGWHLADRLRERGSNSHLG